MNINVSHESPLALATDALLYNDYDYALVHLFEHPNEKTAARYFSFFKNSVHDGRLVYLDNSIFELGESFDSDKYNEWISKLDPTYYIVPDVLEDAQGTITSFSKWFAKIHDTRVADKMCIGVVQGQDWNDLVQCYKFMAANADMVAISFDYSYYLSTGVSTMKYYNMATSSPQYAKLQRGEELQFDTNPMNCGFCKDKMHRYMTGRQRFIQQLIDEGIWDWSKQHHLLGCSLAREFKYYVSKGINNIYSIDTSNPVMAGLQGYRYYDDYGLDGKPSGLLADSVDVSVDDEFETKRQNVIYNTDCFKKILSRPGVFDLTRGAHEGSMHTYSPEGPGDCGDCGN
jgi:hypothetical protein